MVGLFIYIYTYIYGWFIKGNLEVKLPTIWTDGKAEVGRVREEKKRSEKRKRGKKEDAGARKGREVAIHCVFPMICGSGGSKSNLAKAAGESQLARWEIKNCTPLWREAHFQVKMYKAHHSQTTFGSWAVEKEHISKSNVQNTPASDHFWKLSCRKRAHFQAKCTKHASIGPLLEVEMSKKCTPMWREAHFQVKCTKHASIGPLLEVEMSKKCTPMWREARVQVKMYKTRQHRTTFGRSDVEKVDTD